MSARPLFLGLVLGVPLGVVGTYVVLSRRRPDVFGGGLGDPEVNVHADGTQRSMSYARERAAARKVMRKHPPVPRYHNTGSYVVRPLMRPRAQGYLASTFRKAVSMAKDNASGFVPYVILQVLDTVDWRICQDRHDVGCGVTRVVGYVDEKGRVTAVRSKLTTPPAWPLDLCAGGDRMVPELGY